MITSMASSTCPHHRSAFPRCKDRPERIFSRFMYLSFRGELDIMSKTITVAVRSQGTGTGSGSASIVLRRQTKSKSNRKRSQSEGSCFHLTGPSGKILVVEDTDASFTKSITTAGSPVEYGNRIWFCTKAKDKDSLHRSYSKAKNNFKDTSSFAGKKRFNVVYELTPQSSI